MMRTRGSGWSASNIDIPPKLRDAIWRRDRGICQGCGRKVRKGAKGVAGGSIDHIRNVAEGGERLSRDNLQLLCGNSFTGCHGKKTRSEQNRGKKRRSERGKCLDDDKHPGLLW
ncbi:HNH endonuclease [Gordonia sp. NPDC003950]